MMQRILPLLAATLVTLSATMAPAQQQGWQKLNIPSSETVGALAIGPAGHLYAQFGQRTHRSTDHGVTWSPAGVIDDEVGVIRVSSAGTLYAAAFSSLYCSTDEGNTWGEVNWTAGHAWDVAVNSKGHLFVGTENNLVQHSTDNGATWRIRGAQEMGPVWSIAVDAEDRVFAGCQGEGFFSSTNNGGLWRWTLKNHLVYGIAIGRNGEVFAGTQDSGLYRSTNHGVTFTRTPLLQQSGLQKLTIGQTMAINAAGDLVVYGFSFGGDGPVNPVFRSTDNGDHWERFDQGLELASGEFIRAMAIDPEGTLFLSTSKGIYRRAGGAASVERERGADGMLALASGNPIRGGARFAIELAGRTHATLRIIDAAGREVARPCSGELEAGGHLIEWDASGVPPGAYLCQLVAGGRVGVMKIAVVR